MDYVEKHAYIYITFGDVFLLHTQSIFLQVVVRYDLLPDRIYVWIGLNFMNAGESWSYKDEHQEHKEIILIDSTEVCVQF